MLQALNEAGSTLGIGLRFFIEQKNISKIDYKFFNFFFRTTYIGRLITSMWMLAM